MFPSYQHKNDVSVERAGGRRKSSRARAQNILSSSSENICKGRIARESDRVLECTRLLNEGVDVDEGDVIEIVKPELELELPAFALLELELPAELLLLPKLAI